MGWRDRDWARFDESERRALYGSGGLRRSTSRAARLSLLVVVALAAAGCIAAGRLPRHHPLVPALAFGLPHLQAGRASARLVASSGGHGRMVPLGGSPLATEPSTYTIRGRTASLDGLRVTGDVVLRGRWNKGAWHVVGRTRTDAAGNFNVTSRLRRRGLLELRLETPDGFVGIKVLYVSARPGAATA